MGSQKKPDSLPVMLCLDGLTLNSLFLIQSWVMPSTAVVQPPSHVRFFCVPRGLQPTRLLCSWYVPGKNTGAGCHLLLQGIFATQGSNPCLLYGQGDSIPLGRQ